MNLRRSLLEAIAGDRYLVTDMHDVDDISFRSSYLDDYTTNQEAEVEWTFEVDLGKERNSYDCRQELKLVSPILKGMLDNLDAEIVSSYHDPEYDFPMFHIESHYRNVIKYRIAGKTSDLYKVKARFQTVAESVTVTK